MTEPDYAGVEQRVVQNAIAWVNEATTHEERRRRKSHIYAYMYGSKIDLQDLIDRDKPTSWWSRLVARLRR